MKQLALLALPLMLAACNGGSAPNDRPYSITLEPLGYSYLDGKYTIKNVAVEFFSSAGASDVRSVDYTAIMLNTKGERAAVDNSVIVPASGTLFGKLRGGYICTGTTAIAACNWMSPDAVFTNTGSGNYSENKIQKFIMPIEWAVAHNTDTQDSAGWYAEFTFSAVQGNGTVVKWKQNYQIVAPAGGA